jgi:hypothetical protein
MRGINGWVESLPLTNMRNINGWVESKILRHQVKDFSLQNIFKTFITF